jgi:ABC transporter substrate binding protein
VAFFREHLTGVHYVVGDLTASQARFIIDTARTKKLPTTFAARRLSAKYVQQIFTGASPKHLAVASLSKVGLAVNIKTARELGLTISQVVLLRADKVIE